ncbi:MAG: methyltransferase domain-containing protein [Coleofasciculaceae cyanobacterium SM2_3_26]|nr:methyltransferase domain-containing protein [Coleofasciculaceae cyanobacterium SM2_3_26]
MPDPVLPNAAVIHQAVGEACKRRTAARGSLEMPCVPALLDRHLQRILGVLQALGQPITQKEVDSLRQVLTDRLREGFERSPLSMLVFEFEPPAPYAGLGDGIKVRTFIKEADLAEKYDELFQVRQEPFFGTLAPDAKVMDVAAALGTPTQTPVLDIGAASGRNSLPLAQKGHPVEALELSPAFAQSLRQQAQQQGVLLEVVQGDILDPLTRPKLSYYRLAIAVGVIPHFRDVDALRLLLLKCAMYCNLGDCCCSIPFWRQRATPPMLRCGNCL